ncbi:MAG: hypothetical protein C0392_15545 [Syntrophus sp. (in: bacteria)]|nr:hypothetical protein [Syntrophus sp. (in: bacteria)]
MKLKSFLCVMLVACFLPFVATAADKNSKSTSAMEQLKSVEKTSKDAAKDAKAGKEESAREKAGQGWGGNKAGK